MALFFGMWVGLESWEIKTGSHIVFVVVRKIKIKELTSKTNINDLICVNLFLIYYFIYLYISFYPNLIFYWLSSVWSQSCPTPCNYMNLSTAGLPVHHHSQSLPEAISVESVMPSSHLILCHPLLLLPLIFPSIRVLSNESALCIRWPKYWSFSFNISPSNEHPELICSRIDWLDLLAVQGTLKSLLQHHSSKASSLQGSAFFIVQLSHPYLTTGKTIALTRWTFIGKV